MKLSIPAGTTSKRIGIFIQDSSSTTGAGLAGLTSGSAGLTCYSWIDTDGNVAATAQALQAMTLGTWLTRGFVKKDDTNMPGSYEFGIPDALLAAGVKWAQIMFKGATNMAPLVVEIEVTAVSNQDSVRGGMTALPNATAGAANGLVICGSNAATTFATLTVTGAMTFTGNVVLSDGLTVSAPSTANRAGITVTGNGTGAGVSITGGNGATGNGVDVISNSTNGIGLNITGKGTQPGMLLVGGATGHGLQAKGGATSGDGANIVAQLLGHGMTLTGVGATRHGINAAGGATTSHGALFTGGGVGHGIYALSGTGATGDGIRAQAQSTNGHGMNMIAIGTGHGMLATGGATGNGVNVAGGATSGAGMYISAGGAGDGISIFALSNANGISISAGGGGATGDGINIITNATNGSGINTTGAGTGDGMRMTGGAGAGGDGAAIIAGGGVSINAAILGTPAGASISADIASIKTDTGTTIPNLIAALNNLSAAQVKTQVVAALDTDTYAQPGQATPAATTTITLMVRYLYKAWRNQSKQTSSQYSLFNDDAVTVDQKATFADDGTTATTGEVTTGP